MWPTLQWQIVSRCDWSVELCATFIFGVFQFDFIKWTVHSTCTYIQALLYCHSNGCTTSKVLLLYLWCFSLYNNSYYIPIYTLKNTLYNAQILTGLELLKYLLSCYIIVNIHNVIFLRLQKSPRLDVLCCLMPSVNCRPNRQLKKFFVSRSVVLSGRSVSTTEYFLGTYPEAISPK